jgi:hypothetical protein
VVPGYCLPRDHIQQRPRVVLRISVAGQGESLVTWNARDFDCEFIRKHAITIMGPDAYLCALCEEFPDETHRQQRRPPMTPVDLVDALDRAGVKEFAPIARSLLTRLALGKSAWTGPEAACQFERMRQWSMRIRINDFLARKEIPAIT